MNVKGAERASLAIVGIFVPRLRTTRSRLLRTGVSTGALTPVPLTLLLDGRGSSSSGSSSGAIGGFLGLQGCG